MKTLVACILALLLMFAAATYAAYYIHFERAKAADQQEKKK